MASPTGSAKTADRPLRADAARNQARLLAAAREVFGEDGSEAPLEDVARRAGVGIGTLYRRFPTRLALLEAMHREDVDVLAAQAEEVVREPDAWDGFARWVRRLSDYAGGKRALLQQLADAVDRDSETMSHSRETVTRAATRVLAHAQEAGVVRADVAPADLIRLVGGCTMMGTLDREQHERMVQVVLDGLRVR